MQKLQRNHYDSYIPIFGTICLAIDSFNFVFQKQFHINDFLTYDFVSPFTLLTMFVHQ